MIYVTKIYYAQTTQCHLIEETYKLSNYNISYIYEDLFKNFTWYDLVNFCC